MAYQYKASIVRVSDNKGRVFGGGFFINSNRVVTCAHVVEEALNLASDSDEAPEGLLYIDFPILQPHLKTLVQAV